MAMEEMDDFGDLYADLEGQVSAGISTMPSIQQLYIEDGKKSDAKAKKTDSDNEEHILHSRIDETGCSDETVATSDEKGPKDMESEDRIAVMEDDDYSDSEDDLHIVLNEEDCGRFPPSHGIGLGNGCVLVEGSNDEDDDLVIVTETDCQNKDRKWTDPLQFPADGLEHTGAERGNSSKGGYLSQYSQFKYVRSHSGYPGNARAIGSGGVVSFSSSISGRGDWDVNSVSQLMVPCSAVTASNVASPAVVQHGFDFSLPRNRSIFDVSIDTFEWKPWRNHGVDTTDFFNFGLNEESWKQYCERLEHFRKQTTMRRLNQVFESEFLNEVVSAEAMSTVAAQFGRGELITSTMEKPKGRAIQVEGGFSERRPSMDTRRPRHRDSDVVIQITMEGSSEHASSSGKEQPEHTDDIKSENGNYEGSSTANVVSSLDHDGPKKKEIIKSDEQCNQNLEAIGDKDNPSREDASILGTESASGDQVLCSSTPSYLESHSEPSRDEVSLDKVLSPAKKLSLGSVSGLKDSVISDECPSSGSRSNASEMERHDSRDSFQDHNIIKEEQRCGRRRKLHSLAELKVAEDDDDHVSRRKGWNDVNLLEMSCRTKERKFDCDYNEDLSSYREAEMSISYGTGRKRVSGNFHMKHSHKKGDSDPDLRKNWDRRDYFLEKKATSRSNGTKQTDIYFRERGQNSRGARVVTHKEFIYSNSDQRSLYTEEDWCSWQRIMKEDDHWARMEAEFDDTIMEHRYRAGCIQEGHRKHMPYSDEEEEILQHKFGRNSPFNIRELKSVERSKYDRDLCFNLDSSRRYAESSGNKWRHPDYSSSVSETYREPRIVDERGWHDVIRLRNVTSNSGRSSERCTDRLRLPYIRDIHPKKHRNGVFFSPSSKESHLSSYERDHDFDDGYFRLEEETMYPGYTVSSEKQRYGWLSGPAQRTDEEVSFRHQRRDNSDSAEPSFLCKSHLKHEKGRGNHSLVANAKFSNSEDTTRKKIFAQGNTNSEAGEQNNALRRRHTVSRHLNGWEGKFISRCGKVADKGNKQSNAVHAVDEERENFSHTEELHAQKVLPPGSEKMEGDCTRVISSKVERIRKRDSEHSSTHSDKKCPDKYLISEDLDVLEIEEGQLIEEPEIKDVCTVLDNWDSEKTVVCSAAEANWSGDKDKAIQLKYTANKNEMVGAYDKNRILETLAKLERRRERFKEPSAPKKEPDNSLKPQSDLAIETGEVQQRPTRKRRWGAT